MRVANWIILLCLATLSLSCEKEAPPIPEPSSPTALTTEVGKDEDPTVIQTKDGTFYIAWFSERGGNNDIWITHSKSGNEWSTPLKIISHPDEDLYPQLIQASNGTFYLTWFRITVDTQSKKAIFHIWFASSTDGDNWSNLKQLSESSSTFNWVPTLMQDKAGTLWIAYASGRLDMNKEIYLLNSTDGGLNWMGPTRVTQHAQADDFPHLLQLNDGTYMIAWTRYDETPGVFNPKSENFVATSANGISWGTATLASPPDLSSQYTDIFPHLFSDRDGVHTYIAWTSDRSGPGGGIFYAPIDKTGLTGSAMELATGGTAYSPRIIATQQSGVYLMAWVSSDNAASKPDIFYEFIRL